MVVSIDHSKIKPYNTVGNNPIGPRPRAKSFEDCTPEEIQERIAFWKGRIEEMGHYEMAHLYRFAPAGHPIFDSRYGDLYDIFCTRFREFGGLTPEISKKVGWDK